MSSPIPDYSGMTVNERLFVAALFEPFDAAIAAGDRAAAIETLQRVAVGDQAAAIVDAVLENSARYGFPR